MPLPSMEFMAVLGTIIAAIVTGLVTLINSRTGALKVSVAQLTEDAKVLQNKSDRYLERISYLEGKIDEQRDSKAKSDNAYMGVIERQRVDYIGRIEAMREERNKNDAQNNILIEQQRLEYTERITRLEKTIKALQDEVARIPSLEKEIHSLREQLLSLGKKPDTGPLKEK